MQSYSGTYNYNSAPYSLRVIFIIFNVNIELIEMTNFTMVSEAQFVEKLLSDSRYLEVLISSLIRDLFHIFIVNYYDLTIFNWYIITSWNPHFKKYIKPPIFPKNPFITIQGSLSSPLRSHALRTPATCASGTKTQSPLLVF